MSIWVSGGYRLVFILFEAAVRAALLALVPYRMLISPAVGGAEGDQRLLQLNSALLILSHCGRFCIRCHCMVASLCREVRRVELSLPRTRSRAPAIKSSGACG